VRLVAIFVLALLLASVGTAYVWLNQPLAFAGEIADLSIEPGTNVKDITQLVGQAGVQINPELLYWWFRLSGKSRLIKAGSYELDHSTTPLTLLNKLVRGDESFRAITIVEGWNFRQLREALRKADLLKPTTQAMSADEIMQAIGRAGVSAEGHFFPDTYNYAKGSTDLAVLARAAKAMDKKLDQAWATKNSATALQTPEQALILASIVEKETGRPSDRPMISSVFNNRLRLGMRLQTDPTVIYGMGEHYAGNLHKTDLTTDTPWNTYTRTGLPPTPIAMPGKAALLAAVQPAVSKALYFVARGDGSSEFSATLEEHNRAVNKYQRGQ
jgi:UPF0755 protein